MVFAPSPYIKVHLSYDHACNFNRLVRMHSKLMYSFCCYLDINYFQYSIAITTEQSFRDMEVTGGISKMSHYVGFS